jgi:hypothetical protein
LERAVCLAGTAAPWSLDGELLSGIGFDRFVHVPPPDWHARLHRIRLRARRRRIDLEDHLERIARTTAGWSGDEIAGVIDRVAALAGESRIVLPPMVVSALSGSSSATATWRRQAFPMLAYHDEHGGFDDMVPHLDIWHG